jgi:glyoxylase-like metal-dependent hydrolase (beta-lactamase superfamily II)
VLVESIRLGALETNCWIAGDGSGPVVVIDPGGYSDRLLRQLGERPVAAVVLTHAHFDHLGAVDAVTDAAGAPLLIHTDDADRLTSAAAEGTGGAIFGFNDTARPADRLLEDGDVIEAGSLRLRVLHTPGHTRGGISLFAEDPAGGVSHLFSGDTVFAGSVGRTDFPGGDARALSRSIADKIAPLPPETVIHPGHGPDTTVGREARINPFWPRA